MGGWKMEVTKMAIYMAFPVTLFHLFNQPELFEGWVTQVRRELYPPENKMHREEIQECIRKMREKDDKKLLQLLEEEKKKHLV
ncbi:protein PET100 homolog, mitochondrial [Ischnura elegans]|uniref:protein PET100 homolog, mitochondrial n=1 Tax=Ischnura elegans TaxID=197161 RepID=UPI001ED86F97|nr:protein PET100 homolog, mitochondrial [Ischnura elegans]XP_046403909.1 protein PET100 homolog, mitochondrial [Ischnura elegans]XP_046403917.1 protein PET100 homolog, mitochondrial [Ischnura elegans]XP_046403923.1 protein PET100 homolog, mitochondrial [Ischnura elegans]